jgi:subtilisin family serine protease
VSWRIVGSEGPIVESHLVAALNNIAETVERHRDGVKGGHALDVLNLSMGYYHETPEDLLFDPTMYLVLKRISDCGTLIVCSAGNDGTARPLFPAAFAPWLDGNGPIQQVGSELPVVSVGALNPNTSTDALFSNAGPWVRSYAPGALLMSTLPVTFEGGLQPTNRLEAFSRVRESVDPDDFTGGFATWSGTSFAAPLLAGRIAAHLNDELIEAHGETTREEAVARTWRALVKETDLRPV